MNIRKIGLCLLSGLVLTLAADYLLFPSLSSASDDKKSKTGTLQRTSALKSSGPSNYDAFLAEPLRFAEDPQLNETAGAAKKTQFEARLGVPTFLWADGGQPTFNTESLKSSRAGSASETAEAAARFYLGNYAEQYRLGRSDLAALEATVHDDGRGAIIVKFKQNIDGVEVFRDELGVLMNRRYELIAMSGYVTGIESNDKLRQRNFELEPEAAVAAALSDLSQTQVESSLINRQPARKNARAAKTADQYISLGASNEALNGFSVNEGTLRAKKVFYHLPNGYVPAYYVEANIDHETNGDLYYSYVVSATDGQILFRNNLTAHEQFSYRVFADTTAPYMVFDGPQGSLVSPHPTGQPIFYFPGYVSQNLVTLQNAPFSRNDPWLPDGATVTTGNNVDAYADISAPDGYNTGDVRAVVTSPNVFNYFFNPNLPRTDFLQRQFAVQQLFFTVNLLHDDFYDSGFDEVSGNAQHDNYGRGGLGNDRFRAEAQDYSGSNNANMSTPADGAQPRMQMYLFDSAQIATLTVLSPPVIAGSRSAGVSTTFGPQTFDISGDVVIADDGFTPTTDACTALVNAGQIAGKIAFIDRGNCDFTLKVRNAQNAGAIGVIIADNVPGPLSGMGGTAIDIMIPSVRITLDQGNLIRAESNVVARLFRTPAELLDGTLDNQIVAHEWGHYISNRLIGNSSGLINNQGVSMGEGWGDFHSLLLTVRQEDISVPANDNWTGVYPMGGYATGHGAYESYYYGIRRLPYSVDLNKNALSFRHIMDGVPLPDNAPIKLNGLPNSQVHNSGEVWATMLWECYVSLLRAHPFQEARERMKRYLVNGYKMTPFSPTFVEARNALIAAAVANDPADGARFAAAFARRGLGVRAVAPERGSSNHAGVVESFSNAPDLAIVSATITDNSGDQDSYLDSDETGVVTVTLRNIGFQSVGGATATISSSSPNLTFPNGTTIALPPSAPFSSDFTASFDVAAGTMTGFNSAEVTITLNIPGSGLDAPTFTFTERLNADERPNAAVRDNIETRGTLWTVGRGLTFDPESYSNWRMFRPDGGITNKLWYGAEAPYPTDNYLISPPLIVGATGGFSMTFNHSHGFEFNGGTYYDGGVVEMSLDDGATWIDIGTSAYNGTIADYSGNLNPLRGRPAFVGSNSGATTTINVDSTGFSSLAPGSSVRVRFRIGTDNAVGGGGWQVDDISFSGITNAPFSVLVPHLAPTAAQVMVAGRVVLPNGATVPNALVTMTGTQGTSRTVRTNSFGYFRFEDVPVGDIYVFEVNAKRYQFAPQALSVTDDVPDLIFTASE